MDVGETVKIGYLAQEEPDMDTSQRVIDYIKDIAEYVQTSEGRISAPHRCLSGFVYPGYAVYACCKSCPAARRRLYLLSILVRGVNVFILDEPSNNVDIPNIDDFGGLS